MTLLLRRVVLLAIVIALVVVVRLFPDRNQVPVDIDLLVTSIAGVELWMALGVTFFAGVGVTLLVSSLFMVRSLLVRRRYRRAISDLEAEVHHLRNLPLATGDPFAEEMSHSSATSGAQKSAETDRSGRSVAKSNESQTSIEKKRSERI